EDDRPGVTAAVVISNDLWHTRFGGDPAVLGKTITLEAQPAMIVGIMPPGFRGISFATEIWAPLQPFEPDAGTSRNNRWLLTMGRLRANASMEAAQADMEALT